MNEVGLCCRKEFGYLDSWDQYPEFTKGGSLRQHFVSIDKEDRKSESSLQ